MSMRSFENQPHLYDYCDSEGNKLIIAGAIDFAQLAEESDQSKIIPIDSSKFNSASSEEPTN